MIHQNPESDIRTELQPTAAQGDPTSLSGISLSRRQMLFLSGAALAGGAYYLGQQVQQGADETNDMFSRLWLSNYGRINPEPPFLEPTPEILSLVRDIFENEKLILNALGLKEIGFYDSKDLPLIPSPHLIADYQLDIWNKISATLPQLTPGVFTPHAYYNLMFRGLPEALARYGIYAQTDIACVYEISPFRDMPQQVEPVHNFYFISKIEPYLNSRINQTPVKVIFIGKPVVIGDQGMLQKYSADWAVLGKLACGNIVVNEFVHEESESQEELHHAKLETRGFKPRADDEIIATAIKGKDPKEIICKAARDKLRMRMLESQGSREDAISRTVAHEVQHFIDFQDPDMMRHYKTVGVASIKEFVRRINNLTAHSEINAHLVDLMEAQDKASPLLKLLLTYSYPEAWSLSYSKALPWIVDRILDEVVKEHEKYRIVFKKDSGIEPRLQALLQIDRLCDAPEEFNTLLGKIKEAHRSSYGEDLVSEPFSARARRAFLEWPTDKILQVATGGVTVLAAAALKQRISLFLSHRALLKLENQLREVLQEHDNTDPTITEKIIADLQIGRTGKRVDNERRLDAITKLASLPETRPVISQLFKS